MEAGRKEHLMHRLRRANVFEMTKVAEELARDVRAGHHWPAELMKQFHDKLAAGVVPARICLTDVVVHTRSREIYEAAKPHLTGWSDLLSMLEAELPDPAIEQSLCALFDTGMVGMPSLAIKGLGDHGSMACLPLLHRLEYEKSGGAQAAKVALQSAEAMPPGNTEDFIRTLDHGELIRYHATIVAAIEKVKRRAAPPPTEWRHRPTRVDGLFDQADASFTRAEDLLERNQDAVSAVRELRVATEAIFKAVLTTQEFSPPETTTRGTVERATLEKLLSLAESVGVPKAVCDVARTLQIAGNLVAHKAPGLAPAELMSMESARGHLATWRTLRDRADALFQS